MYSGLDNSAGFRVSDFDPITLAGGTRTEVLPGAIQPHAALLALAPADLTIIHAAGATASLLGATAVVVVAVVAVAVVVVAVVVVVSSPRGATSRL
mgnify:CR=1 FL=1